MVPKSDRYARRILNFPAVHPCEGVSPAALLDSLITLSHTICAHQAKFFATHRRNAREAIRQIGALRIFLEEIRDRGGGGSLPGCAVLSFSELHVAFQKIQFLLEDCAREGARVWMLAKSQPVATLFGVLAREVATAVDVVPSEVMCGVNGEVREVVEMVARQARKARLEADGDDETALKHLRWVLNGLESRVSPAPDDLRRILDRLAIRSWADCNEEIKFLEAEIDYQTSDDAGEKEKERVVPLLSSLAALMNYCRAVAFQTLDDPNDQKMKGCSGGGSLHCLNPDDFRCPISLQLMTDPVTVSTGQTYDRASITRWLKSGRHICPKTGESLPTTELVPNSALRTVIHRYYCAGAEYHTISAPTSSKQSPRNTAVAGSSTAAEATGLLAEFLAQRLASSGTSSLQHRSKAAYEVRLLSKSSVFNRSRLIQAGAVPPLLRLLTSPDPSAQENAASALHRLSKHPLGKRAIVDGGGLRLILFVLRKGAKLESRQNAAATLFYLASVEEFRRVIAETPRAIPALVALIRDGTSCGKKNAVVALFALLLSPENRRRVIVAGAVPALLALLTAPSEMAHLVPDALAVLASLAEGSDGAAALRHNSALTPIAALLCGSASRVEREYCVSALSSMCADGGAEVVGDLARDGSIMAALYSMLTEGSTHARGKARSLIKILQSVHETTPPGWLDPSAAAAAAAHDLLVRVQ